MRGFEVVETVVVIEMDVVMVGGRVVVLGSGGEW